MADSLPDLIPLQPYLREMVWGGRRLETLLNKQLPPGAPIGESWEVSGYPGQESVVASGSLAGLTLAELLSRYGPDLVGASAWERWGETFPLLIKFIDANVDLSIQVHPDDDYVRSTGLGGYGKSEAWFVVHSCGGRTALGLKDGVDREEFARAIDEGRVLEVIEFRVVKPGDVIFVPPGTVHAANSGIVIYEVQQPSDHTFRIYDYDRSGLDGKRRKLHIEQSLEVINFDGDSSVFSHYDAIADPAEAGSLTCLVDSDNFRLSAATARGATASHGAGNSCLAVSVIDGGPATFHCGQTRHVAGPGDSWLVPPGRELVVEPTMAEDGEVATTYLLASPAIADAEG